MFDTVFIWVANLVSALYTFLIWKVIWPIQGAYVAFQQSELHAHLTVFPYIAAPAVAVIAFVWFRMAEFETRYGASAAKGWAWTMCVYAVGLVVLIYVVMAMARAERASTAAALAPAQLWPIGLFAMAAVTYGVLGTHWIVRKIIGGR